MGVDYFISLVREKYATLDPSDRKQKIRELVAESKEQEIFIRKNFPEFFAEAFPAKRRAKRSASSARTKRAKRR
jgi:hypothetical protein